MIPFRLRREAACMVMVDVQERLLPAISGAEEIRRNTVKLAAAARALSVPFVYTEQYPRGLGPAVQTVRELLSEDCVREKITFSCLGEPSIFESLRAAGRDTILVCGAEAHVCVCQTVHDCLAAGYRVHVAADAVSSRAPENRALALERMARAGAVVTSTEMALFELLERAGTDEFRAVSKLVK